MRSETMATYYVVRTTAASKGFLWRTREEAETFWAQGWGGSRRGGPAPIAEVTVDATPVYNGGTIPVWSIWSDGLIRRGTAIMELYQAYGEDGEPYSFLSERTVKIQEGIDDAAVALIRTALGSDSALPDYLGRVRRLRSLGKTESRAKAGGYQGPQVERFEITLDDGTTLRRAVLSEGYGEGYAFEFFDSEAAAWRSIGRRSWVATECLECGAAYDRSGHVEPGEMGCDRCNGTAETDWARHLVQQEAT